MDGSQFDAWSRRRVGFLVAGLAVTLTGLTDPGDLSARGRKKHHKNKNKNNKRCKKRGDDCSRTSGRRCCGALICGEAESVDLHCCKPELAVCRISEDCCDGFGCFAPLIGEPFCKLA